MTLANEMENHAANNLISSIKRLGATGTDNHGIKDIIKTFLYNDMAIKENKAEFVPFKQPSSLYKDRMRSMNEAKQAFLNSTVHSTDANNVYWVEGNQKEPNIHYAQLAITTDNEDPRSTGGGKSNKNKVIVAANRGEYVVPNILTPNVQKKAEQPLPRKVSFKVKNASISYRRPPVSTKMVTIPSNKVSDLTQKYNALMIESHRGSVKESRIIKTLETLQNNSSAASSPTSSSPNIKIVYRQKRTSKKKNNRKRCSSVDSIDKLVLSDSSSTKVHVIRSKSDGTRIPKSPKKRLKYPTSSTTPETDAVDGKTLESVKETADIPHGISTSTVKSVIKKFECEIVANTNNTLQRRKPTPSDKLNQTIKEKPKVPEKKSNLFVTKNVVVKDGVAKVKTIRPPKCSLSKTEDETKEDNTVSSKKEPIYDKRRYKTSYINTTKLPLHVVEIIQEDASESSPSSLTEEKTHHSIVEVTATPNEALTNNYDIISSNFTPNDSFLWRRKSSTQIQSDTERNVSNHSHNSFNESSDGINGVKSDPPVVKSELGLIVSDKETCNTKESQNEETVIERNPETENNSDFESSLVEAYNREVMVAYTPKPSKPQIIEDDYEPLEPVDNHTEAPQISTEIKTIDRKSKINCPLPEIPKEITTENTENIYQCLLEMRSHPEGDESSIHSYESCENHMEERTRGDGDSDDGYEYCKAPAQPYCISEGSSSPGDQQQINPKSNYGIAKSVSGCSTISYEKIGSERIYEKIPPRRVKETKERVFHSNRNSFMSDTTYNDGENIYDTIKHSDGVSLSHCYESIPNSPSMAKVNNFKKQLASAIQKTRSFDSVSNISQSTMSSEHKSNSIYGQRSVISFNGQEITFQVPNSDTSVSDRSEDWVDVSDEERTEQQKILIVRERSKGRRSPISWSQKVRHQWQKTPKHRLDNKDGDSSDSGHVYESLEPPPPPPEDDFDSFDSDSDTETHYQQKELTPQQTVISDRLPEPPSGGGGQYTLTKIASAAQRKMRQLKRNLTKRYTVAVDGKNLPKSLSPTNGFDTIKSKSKPYENWEKPELEPIYSNITCDSKPLVNKTDNQMANVNGSFKEELRSLYEKRIYEEVPTPLSQKTIDKPTTPTSEGKKDVRKSNYFSLKSRFRRATSSTAVDMNSEVPSALKITNSTFYLTDSMDGDSGFSNCSDAPADGSRTASPHALRQSRESRRPAWCESAPCLARLERPTAPPPPPPPNGQGGGDVNGEHELKRLLPSLPRKEKTIRTRTSWYAECGGGVVLEEPPPPPINRQSSTSWYAEAGLYEAGNISSSSSGASSESHADSHQSQPGSPLPQSLFNHEPLYQFYNAAKVESVCRDSTDSDSEVYDAPQPPPPPAAGRPSAMALVAPRGPARTLWCEVPEVVNSAVLSSLAPGEKRLQEAKFEILTSEASYLNSLDVLDAHFMSHPAFRDTNVLPAEDWEALFGCILPVRKSSQLLLCELERCWQESILLRGLCDVLRRHAAAHFHAYVKYCEQQAPMVKTLQRLRERPAFAATLKRLEMEPACQSLTLHSFLMLPMQRVTRLPLLLDAVLRHLAPHSAERDEAQAALTTLTQLVSQCNEGARNTDRLEEMLRLSRLIEFPAAAHDAPDLAPALSRRDRKPVRWLVRSGEMTQLVWKADDSKLTFGKKFNKVPLHVYLFNDVLVIAKKKSESCQVAVDWCARSLVEVCGADSATPARHPALLTLLENRHKRTVEMLMSCPTETDLSRWSECLSAGGGGGGAEGGEAVYAGWDCPQVAALYAHRPAQPDELALAEGDVVNVTRKTSEGWYYGERIRDGESGWFPGAYTVEIASPHVRARNLRQRYRLLALSGTYLGQKKKPTT